MNSSSKKPNLHERGRTSRIRSMTQPTKTLAHFHSFERLGVLFIIYQSRTIYARSRSLGFLRSVIYWRLLIFSRSRMLCYFGFDFASIELIFFLFEQVEFLFFVNYSSISAHFSLPEQISFFSFIIY